ncbi:MAG: DUF393 domain-containing protein [Hyphomicrobiales bacterium]
MHKPYSFRDDDAVPSFDYGSPIAVMDAECAVCSWGAQMIHQLDRTGRVRICPIQTPLGAALLTHYNMEPKDPSSWLFIDKGIAHADFDGVLYAGHLFGGWGRLTVVLRIFPKPIRDWLYTLLARHRYALFGKKDMCAVPDPDFQKRLM